MKKLFLTTLCFILLTTFTPQTIKANSNSTEFYVTDNLKVDTNSIEPLYNIKDEIIAYYFKGDTGYAIIGIDGTIVEYSDNTCIDRFNNQDSEKSYYLGVGEYYVESNSEDSLINVFSDEEIDKDEGQTVEIKPIDYFVSSQAQDIIDVDNNKKSVTITYPDNSKDPKGNTTYTNTIYNTLSLKAKKNLPFHTRYFCYNTNGTCGSTAAAIMMYYYYDHIGSSYITNNAYKGTSDTKQKAFVNHFKNLLGDDGSGTKYSDVKNGINKYLGEIGKSQNCTYVTDANILYSVSSKIISCINDNKPCIVGLNNEPTYNDHWVVGIGYATYYGINGHTRGNVHFIKVNNGWYSSSNKSIVYVNYKYVDGLIYLS